MLARVRWFAARPPRSLAALLCASVVAASGCSTREPSEPPAPPTGVHITPVDGSPGVVRLSWTPPAGRVSGFLVELKVGAGSFTPQNDLATLVPPDATALEVTLAADAPDLVTYVVRMQSARGATTSDYSNEAAYLRPLQAPRAVSARFDWDALGVRVEWERGSTAATGYVVERATAEDTSGWPIGAWSAVGAADVGEPTFLDTTVATDQTYVYRVANVATGATSAASHMSEAVTAGLLPPSPLLAAFDHVSQAINLSWSTGTSDATATRLERRRLDASFVPLGDWERVDLPEGVVTSFLDRTWAEATGYGYRVTNLRGAFESPPATFPSRVPTPLRAPTELAAAPASDGIDVSWVNHSAVATYLELSWRPDRGNGTYASAAVTLPPDAAAHGLRDVGLGFYRLAVMARSPSTVSRSAEVDFTTPNPPDAPVLEAGALASNGASGAVARPGGGWAFLSTSPSPELAILSSDAWPALKVASNLVSYAPFFGLDAAGHAHLVHAAPASGGGDPLLVHRSFDGSAWASETLFQGPIVAFAHVPSFEVALDATRSPHALVIQPGTAGTYRLTYVHRTEAGWTSEVVLTAYAAHRSLAFGLDPTGAPHFVETRTDGKLEWTRGGDGAWHSTPILPLADFGAAVDGACWVGDDHAVALFHRVDSTAVPYRYQLGVAEKVGGTWQPLRLLASDPSGYPFFTPRARLGASGDGSRVAIVHSAAAGVRAYFRDGGTWRKTLLGPPGTYGWESLGFDAANRAAFLLEDAASRSYVTLTEP